jgi:hypothetical protein
MSVLERVVFHRAAQCCSVTVLDRDCGCVCFDDGVQLNFNYSYKDDEDEDAGPCRMMEICMLFMLIKVKVVLHIWYL